MDRKLMIGIVLGGVGAVSVGAVAGYRALTLRDSYAEVLSVEPVTRDVRTPHRHCWSETVMRPAPTRDPDQVAGTVMGAVVGGALGHQIGGGRGKTLATVAGVVTGGYAGHEIQKRVQAGDTTPVQQTRCETTYTVVHETDGYVVRYRLGDSMGIVHMDHDPGPRIPAQDGKLVLPPTEPRDG